MNWESVSIQVAKRARTPALVAVATYTTRSENFFRQTRARWKKNFALPLAKLSAIVAPRKNTQRHARRLPFGPELC
jgi:hypothetical protein